MHTLVIYAFSNIDDISWGTKGLAGSGKGPYYEGKITWVGKWLFSNAFGAFILVMLNSLDSYYGSRGYVMVFLAIYSTFILMIKFVFGFLNHCKYYLWDYNCNRKYWSKDCFEDGFVPGKKFVR